jgi:putative SOS response-associated peptidase YedK
VRALVEAHVEALPAHERDALFLQTQAGRDWLDEEPPSPEPMPVSDDDIVDYVTTRYIYREARDWSNARIRAYIDRCNMRD